MLSIADWEPSSISLKGDRQGPYFGPDRRSSSRVPLNWTVYLSFDNGETRFQAQTRDISSNCFYCIIKQLVKLGDRLECVIVVPAHDPRRPDDVVYLRCQVRVVRVEAAPTSAEFGLACRIEDYRVIYAPRPEEGLKN